MARPFLKLMLTSLTLRRRRYQPRELTMLIIVYTGATAVAITLYILRGRPLF